MKFPWIYIRKMFLKFRVINDEYIVNISRGKVKGFVWFPICRC